MPAAKSLRQVSKTIKGRRLILISNRGPIEIISLKNNQLRYKATGGGLSTALRSALSVIQATWVAAAQSRADQQIAQQNKLLELPPENPRYFLKLVYLPHLAYQWYYNEISNKYLWYLQHYLFDTLRNPMFDEQTKQFWQEGYVVANKKFAQVALAETKSVDNPIFICNDYHLYLVPAFLRMAKPRATLLHFTHIPCPSPDYWRFLPQPYRNQIFSSLLNCDIIAFHSWRYVDNFLNCCKNFLDTKIERRSRKIIYGDRQILVKAYPISVSVSGLEEFASTSAVKSYEKQLKEDSKKYKLIVRVDRAELSKNFIRGFDAFTRLLNKYPKWRKKVRFIVYAYPTRQDLLDYQFYQQQIRRKVKQINQKFGDNDWQPIELRIRDNYARAIAALKHYDVLLVNPIYDGMNLVCKEGAIVNQKNGVIILSENAGAIDELRDSVLPISPFDIEQTTESLNQALSMTPIEKLNRAERAKRIVTRNDINKWLFKQLSDIVSINHYG
jgi:trehalose 6-phosphate synthase